MAGIVLRDVTFAVASYQCVDAFVRALRNLGSEVVLLNPDWLTTGFRHKMDLSADVIVIDGDPGVTALTDPAGDAARLKSSEVLNAFPQFVCAVYPISVSSTDEKVLEPEFLAAVLAALVCRLKTGHGQLVEWPAVIDETRAPDQVKMCSCGTATVDKPTKAVVSIETARQTPLTKHSSPSQTASVDSQIQVFQFDRGEESASPTGMVRRERGHQLVQAAVEYIERQFHDAITLTDAAHHVHCNATYLSHLFKEVMGVSFVQYLTTCRISRAQELLQNPKLKVYEVGELVGFPNPRYFSEIFKKYTAYSPYEFRNVAPLTGTDSF